MKRNVIFSAAVIAIAAAFIAIGIWTGEPSDVFSKATMICMECIGLG